MSDDEQPTGGQRNTEKEQRKTQKEIERLLRKVDDLSGPALVEKERDLTQLWKDIRKVLDKELTDDE